LPGYEKKEEGRVLPTAEEKHQSWSVEQDSVR
jgi:hypothetical protein